MIGVALAGGSGTRFWPLSRTQRPKQLVRLWDDTPMIAQTIERLDGISSPDKRFVVLGEHLVESTRKVLPDTHFVVEPFPRNTAPAIGLAAIHSLARFGDEPMAIFPADHFIGGIEKFEMCLRIAAAKAKAGHIVTLGIEPTRPETGYGYIHHERPSAGQHMASALTVREFVEKPSQQLAKEYLDGGDYVWNSGMFVLTPSTLLDEMSRQLPTMYDAMVTIREAIDTDRQREVVREQFGRLDDISIDYGIMEGADDVVVIPAAFDWSDVGHWAAVDEVCETDKHGNVVHADALLSDVRDCVIFTEDTDRLVAACGVDDLVIVDTPDALLVIPKERAQQVKALVDELEQSGRDELL